MEVFVTTVPIPQIDILFMFCPCPPLFVCVDAHSGMFAVNTVISLTIQRPCQRHFNGETWLLLENVRYRNAPTPRHTAHCALTLTCYKCKLIARRTLTSLFCHTDFPTSVITYDASNYSRRLGTECLYVNVIVRVKTFWKKYKKGLKTLNKKR